MAPKPPKWCEFLAPVSSSPVGSGSDDKVEQNSICRRHSKLLQTSNSHLTSNQYTNRNNSSSNNNSYRMSRIIKLSLYLLAGLLLASASYAISQQQQPKLKSPPDKLTVSTTTITNSNDNNNKLQEPSDTQPQPQPQQQPQPQSRLSRQSLSQSQTQAQSQTQKQQHQQSSHHQAEAQPQVRPNLLEDINDDNNTIFLQPNQKLTGHLRFEFQRYDGWYNNLANSDWGTPNSRLRRKVAPAYSDGVYQMNDDGRPSARLLSQRMMRGEDGLSSKRNLTTIFAFFGQIISSEILMASESGCPIEMHRIKIEKCDPMYDRDCRGGRTMPFYRAAYDPTTGQSPNLPREQLNRVTSWIDGSFIYSTSETWLNTMRAFDGKGRLKMVSSPAKSSPSDSGSSVDGSSTGGGNNNQGLNLDTLLVEPALAALAGLTTGPALSTSSGGGDSNQSEPIASMAAAAAMAAEAPMSLFGYPMRNRKRAPLINQMPAHHLKMKTAERMFLLGDPRTNQNPIILAFGILFYRWHNVLAERIYLQHPDWSDEEIFQRARRLVIASLQTIFLYEYLPTLLDTPSPYNKREFAQHVARRVSQQVALLKAAGDNNNGTGNELMTNVNVNQLQNTLTELEFDQLDLIRPYTGYKPDLHPGISHVFQSAAFRFGHTLIPPGLYLRDDKCQFLKTPAGYKGIRLCSTWWNAEEVVSKVGIEHLLMGAASQIAEREDYVLCNDVRDKLFGPLDFSRRDLAALNIMRGRDNGLADYNTVRVAFKLPRINKWQDINPSLYERQPELFDELAELYGHQMDKIDLYIGGMLESDVERGRPGPLFRRIIKEQFERLRDSDRFWFENTESGIFSEAEIDEIRRISLYDIIVNATLIPENSIQRNIFKFSPQDPCPQPGQLSSSQLQPCYIVKGHSYFKGSELTYALVCVTLVLIPIICALIASLIVKYQDKKRRQFKAKQEYQRNIAAGKSSTSGRSSSVSSSTDGNSPTNQSQEKCEKFYAKEWLHSQLKRQIKIRFGPAPDGALYILDRKGQVQRRLSLGQSSSVVIELSSSMPYSQATGGHGQRNMSVTNSSASLLSAGKSIDLKATGSSDELAAALDFEQDDQNSEDNQKPMLLIRMARQHDLVLQFYNANQRRKFMAKLHTYLSSINKSMSLFRVPRDIMLANAETKEKRQQRLEQFFREAYQLTFGPGGSGGKGEQLVAATDASKVSPDISMVMRTSLSKQEFAEALGMRSDSLFVKQMFNCIDKDANGRISFQEFLDMVVKFSRGRPEDKLRIVFDMCDHSGKGVIEKSELVRMLRSLVDIAKTKSLTEDEVMKMIYEMFKVNGLENKQLLTYEDFKLIINSSQQGNQGQAQYEANLNAATGSGGNLDTKSTSSKLSEFSVRQQSAAQQQILAIGLDMKGAKKNFFLDTTSTSMAASENHQGQTFNQGLNLLTDNRRPAEKAKGWMQRVGDKWKAFITELEEHRQDIVYLLMFYVIVAVLFFERFIIYAFLSEHMDLRHVMGAGIAITRGSAASLSFCYAMLLLSMCRNLMTWIRTMGVREYIPLDSHVKFHKIVAMTALVMTVLHSVGHCVNFYHVTQQPVEHLRCLTKEMQFSGESRPTFFYWIFQTVTGSTGLVLWILCSIIYIFAHQRVRQRAYSVFWSTHKLYYLIYALTLLHGSSKLTGSPRFWIFFMIPAILFTIDKIMSLQAKLLQLEIFETECLPSGKLTLLYPNSYAPI